MMKNLQIAAIVIILTIFSTAQAQINITFSSSVASICQTNDTTAVITATATGGTAPYTYHWNYSNWAQFYYSGTLSSNPIENGNTLTNVGNGNVWLYVIDANGVTSAQFNTQIPMTLQIQDSIVNAICPQQGQLIYTITGGSGSYNGSLYFNLTTFVGNGLAFNNLQSGFYNYQVSDVNTGCNRTIIDSINNFSSIYANIALSNLTCTSNTATANVVGGIAPYSFVWSTANSISNVAQIPSNGFASVIITDAQGCISSPQYIFGQEPYTINDNAVIAGALCPNNNGSIQLFPTGGVAPYNCVWTNGSTGMHLTNLNDGTYHATIYDANGCYRYINKNVANLTPIYISYSATTSDCINPTGTATLTPSGGQSPYNVTWNSTPNQTGLVLQNVNAGIYGFNVVDANGCLAGGSVGIQATNSISVYPTATGTVCGQNNGTVFTNASSNLPLTYVWNTGQTSPSLYNLTSGTYTCTISNSAGCQRNASAYVQLISPFSVSKNVTNASCIYSSDGSISIYISGGTPPYTVTWNNGMTGLNISNLNASTYYCNINDANGCNFSYNVAVNYNSISPCACRLNGTVFHDMNNNCTIDAGESKIKSVPIRLISSNGNNQFGFTNANGNYNFIVPSGNYSLVQKKRGYYGPGICQNDTITLTATSSAGCIITNNFADTAQSISDLHTSLLSLGPAVSGYGYKQRTIVNNVGTIPINDAKADLAASAYSTIGSTTFTGTNTSANNWTYSGLPTINPGQSFAIDNQYNISPTVPSNVLMLYSDTAYRNSILWVSDNTPWDNIGNLGVTTVSSYDPNSVEVSPKGWSWNGNIGNIYPPTGDSILTYTVHFQNTGTYYAINIEVVDSLSSYLDLSTIEMLYATAPYTVTIDNNNAMHVKFDNIYLPYGDATQSENCGAFMYRVKIKKDIPIGSLIHNQAAIFFDFNAAVITNKATNTIFTNNKEVELKNGYTIFPNPVDNKFTIVSKNENIEGTIIIRDITAKVIDVQNVNTKTSRYEVSNLGNLSPGIYFVSIKNNSETQQTFKFVKR